MSKQKERTNQEIFELLQKFMQRTDNNFKIVDQRFKNIDQHFFGIEHRLSKVESKLEEVINEQRGQRNDTKDILDRVVKLETSTLSAI